MEIFIKGRTLEIKKTLSSNKNATARIRNGILVISLPSRWSASERERIGNRLQKRAIKAIEDGRWSIDDNKKMAFAHGQRITVLGEVFEISVIPGRKFGCRIKEKRIEVMTDDAHPKRNEKISQIVRKKIAEAIMPKLIQRVNKFNEEYFGSRITGIFIRDTISRWGSYSSLGNISLSFRLLFMPEDIIDYVIVHELAHSKHRNHGKKFWALVEKVIPDHREKRSWLIKNGQNYPKADYGILNPKPGHNSDEHFYEEPY